MVRYDSYPKFKAAAVQAGMILKEPPQWFDVEASLAKAVRLIDEASRNGARLIVFPEMWLPGHPGVVGRLGGTLFDEWNNLWAAYLNQGIEVPGPEIDMLCTAARRANAFVVMGINERDKKYYGAMYNSMVYINPHGQILGTHRKITNTVTERLFHTPGPCGDNLKTVFPTEIGNIGGSMCNEHSQYLLQYLWLMLGLEVNCSLWPGYTTNKGAMQARVRGVSACSGVWSIAACPYIPREAFPQSYFTNPAHKGINPLCGGSGIVSPQGEYQVGPLFDEEGIVYGEIDLAEIPKKRASVNLTGTYNRWDILSLNVRQHPYQPLNIMEEVEMRGNGAGEDRVRALEDRIMDLEKKLRSTGTGLFRNESE